MAKPINGMIPPGGWHYFQSDVKMVAGSLDALYKVVESFRAENSLPAGDIQGDVDQYICGNHPAYCHGIDQLTINVVSRQAATRSGELLQDVSTWANNVLRSKQPNTLVQDEEAERRAKICKACPHNTHWKSGCISCITSTDRISTSVRQARDTETSKKLGGCSLLRHDNRSAVFFEKENLASTGDLPTNCWLT